MAVPAYTTDLVDILAEMPNTTGWTLISDGGGGGNSLTAPETDDFIQGDNAISRNPWTSANIRGMVYNLSQTIPAGDAVFFWWKADVAQALRTLANGGIQCLIGNASTALKAFYVAGSDTYALGGWRCSPIDPTRTQSVNIGSPSAVTSFFGVRWAVAVTGPQRGFPYKIDAMRRGRSVSVTAGDSADPASWRLFADHASAIARRWGILERTATGATLQGTINWGTGATAVYSREANLTVVFADTLGFVAEDFTAVIVRNAATDLEWSNLTFLSLASDNNRGIVSVENNAKAWLLGCSFADIGHTYDGGSNSKWDGSTWRRCLVVFALGGSFLECEFLDMDILADESALLWEGNFDTSGRLDGSRFRKGPNAHHALELATDTPTTITLIDVEFEGFNVANGENDSAIHVKRTTGTVTINVSGGDSPSYKTDGATVVVVNSTTLTLTGLKNDGPGGGTEIRVFNAGTTTEIAGEELVVSGTFSTGIDAAAYPSVDISILSLGYQNARLLNINVTSDVNIPIQQVVDRQYSNPT